MEIETFFFDTYAFFEIIKGNSNYRNFVKGISIVTTRLNLMELYYWLLIKKGKKEADRYYDFFLKFAIDVDDETIKEAMQFRVSNKNKNLSYVDCIGYTISIRNKIGFLTGDIQFKDLPNVEFVR